MKAALVAFPLIETYALEARPPHELVVRIVERTPIGLIETRAGYTLVDAAGVALSTAATPSAGVPVLAITGGIDSDAFEAAGQVMRALPDDIRAQVTEVTASTPDDVTLTLGGSNAQVVWGSAERVGGQGAEPRQDDGPASAGGRHDLRRVVARGRRRPLRVLLTGTSGTGCRDTPFRSGRARGVRLLSSQGIAYRAILYTSTRG